MGAFKSCLNCTDRTLGCHSTCERYLSEKAEHDRIIARMNADRDYRSYRVSEWGIYNERRIKKRKSRS